MIPSSETIARMCNAYVGKYRDEEGRVARRSRTRSSRRRRARRGSPQRRSFGALTGRALLIEHGMDTRRSAGLVFGRDATTPFAVSTVRLRAARAWKTAKLSPVTLHEARHTYASLMIAAGANAKQLQAYMGHASIAITYDRYGHLLPGDEAQMAQMLDAYLDQNEA